MRLSQEGSDVVLRFPYPSKTNAGETLTNLTGVTVYRELIGAREGERPPEAPKDAAARAREEKGFRARAEAIQKLTRTELDAATVGADVVVRDPLVPLYREGRIGRVFLRYGVTATRDRKKASELSPLVALLPRVPPDRPFRVVPTVEEARVCLDWSAPVAMLDGARPAKVAGYAVYRRDAGDEEYEDRPLGVVDRRDDVRRRDGRARPEVRLHRARGARRGAAAHSRPGVRRGARVDGGRVSAGTLRTASSSSPRRAARASCGTRASRATSPPIASIAARTARGNGSREDLKDPVYFDAGVSAREYGVTAVDKSGNESAIGTAK